MPRQQSAIRHSCPNNECQVYGQSPVPDLLTEEEAIKFLRLDDNGLKTLIKRQKPRQR